MSIKSAVAWAVVKDGPEPGLNIVYHSLAHTSKEAYEAARRVVAVPPYTLRELRASGYIARKVRIMLEDDYQWDLAARHEAARKANARLPDNLGDP